MVIVDVACRCSGRNVDLARGVDLNVNRKNSMMHLQLDRQVIIDNNNMKRLTISTRRERRKLEREKKTVHL